MLRAHWQSRDGGDPAKATVTIGRFGHQLGNCVRGNVMMRLWPQILKGRQRIEGARKDPRHMGGARRLLRGVLSHRARLPRAQAGESRRRTPWWPDPRQRGRAGDLVEAPSEEAEGVIVQ